MDTCVSTLFACFTLASLFVGSLYVWSNPLNRDHPDTIKKRSISVFAVTIISPFITQYFITNANLKTVPLSDLLGLRLPGLLPAAVFPLLLTMVLFLGPLSTLIANSFSKNEYPPELILFNLRDLIWWRNHVIAPFSEEFTFRACMMPLLVQCFKPFTAIFICPLLFGLAHVHHMNERLKVGFPLRSCLILALFEFSYTTLFGAYSALLFIKTGHMIAPFLAHSFCNLMGFPDFNEILAYTNPKRTILISLYFLGVVLWYFLLTPVLRHSLYDNYIYDLL